MLCQPLFNGIYPLENGLVLERGLQFGVGVEYFAVRLVSFRKFDVLLAAQFDSIAPARYLVAEGSAFNKLQTSEIETLEFSELRCDLALDGVFYGIGLFGSTGCEREENKCGNNCSFHIIC